MGETRVDLQHLLEDLRDAYPGALEETILTEILANSLDSGARHIELLTDAPQATLAIVDDGAGMSRTVLRRYHDIAASTKTRGQGIGFAGVGIKLGLLVAEEVVTETHNGHAHIATSWRLALRQRAPWQYVAPPGRLRGRGTAVALRLRNALSPLLDAGFVAAAIQRHFAPLLDADFGAILAARYPGGVRFVVNAQPVAATPTVAPRAAVMLRIGRQRKPSASGYLYRSADVLSEERRGIAVSAMGKIIMQGWEWLGLTPAEPERIGGLVEVPALAESLTLNKSDFLRTGPRGALYLSYRRALQEAVAAQLAAWGAAAPATDNEHRKRARPLERDLQTVLVDLADEFPLLASLVERQPGGQRALPVGGAISGRELAAAAPTLTPLTAPEPADPQAETGTAETFPGSAPLPPPIPPLPPGAPTGARGPRRPTRYGLSIQFESRPDDPALGRLVESTVWVNEAHPAYQRAVASRSDAYHNAVTVAMVLAPLAVEASKTHAFVSAFLAHWGDALAHRRRSGRP